MSIYRRIIFPAMSEKEALEVCSEFMKISKPGTENIRIDHLDDGRLQIDIGGDDLMPTLIEIRSKIPIVTKSSSLEDVEVTCKDSLVTTKIDKEKLEAEKLDIKIVR